MPAVTSASAIGIAPLAAYAHVSGRDELLELVFDQLVGQLERSGMTTDSIC